MSDMIVCMTGSGKPAQQTLGQPAARRRARPGERRQEILMAALEVFAERGYRGASLAAVAERVGLTQQGVLHYFPSKDVLLTEVLRLRDEMDVRVMTATSNGRLADIERLVAYNATRPGLVQSFTVLSAESVTEDHPAREFFTERYQQVRSELARLIRAELGDPVPAGVTAGEAAALLVAVMDGLQQQWLLESEAIDMPALVAAFTRLLRGAGSLSGDAGHPAQPPDPHLRVGAAGVLVGRDAADEYLRADLVQGPEQVAEGLFLAEFHHEVTRRLGPVRAGRRQFHVDCLHLCERALQSLVTVRAVRHDHSDSPLSHLASHRGLLCHYDSAAFLLPVCFLSVTCL
jgi:AcrR family transcriptional regulator